ncbi:hypothetical protein [Vibrio agarivorans]|uniref:hypothetical protein n=1 Tax=Vibrio agarivorans TaxID=153622 RepID=UPI002232677D|nr:hypothetical protein [Vibrio agarivorans]MDN3663431.1 hypothetical protein [Vibrio agarivorans]
MQVSKKEGRIIDDALTQWKEQGVLSQEEFERLNRAYSVSSFDWKQLAKYSFYFAILSIVVSVIIAIGDEWLIALFQKVFSAPDIAKCGFFIACSMVFYTLGLRSRSAQPHKVFSNEAIMLVGILANAVAIHFLGEVFSIEDTTYLMAFATVNYAVLGILMPSHIVWGFSLLSVGLWFIFEASGPFGLGEYFLGVNVPIRFALLGTAMTAGGYALFAKKPEHLGFYVTTKLIGLAYLFIALWVVSLVGNHVSLVEWEKVSQFSLIHWSILLTVVSLYAIYHGVRFKDDIVKVYGLTFFFINLYTRYFEYFWQDMHKALFFAILALSFWFFGSRAEKIYQVSLSSSSSSEAR